MPASSYITSNDIATYLPNVNPAPNAQVWNFFASVVSRWLDDHFGQYFYADGFEVKYWDSDGAVDQITTGGHPFYAKVGNIAACAVNATSLTYTRFRGPIPNSGDVVTLDVGNTQEQVTVNAAPTDNGNGTWTLTLASGTKFAHAANTATTTLQIQLAYFENQPTANWTAVLAGDGVRPPSNMFAWPRNPKNAGSASDPFQRDPWYGVDIAHIPISGTTYLPTAIPGYMTIAIGAHWGWPVVPDVVKDLTGRLVTKIWRARGAGWTDSIGTQSVGQVQHLLAEFNALDEVSLIASRYKNIYL